MKDPERHLSRLLKITAGDMVREKDRHTTKFVDEHDIEHRAWADIISAVLHPREAKIPRMFEIHYTKRKGVWTKNLRSEALIRKGWK